jgi:DNA-binding LacI/PurR family transcriptional regulator
MPTIDDVARQAGVSTATVSRVINEHPRVAAATRRRVRQAMEALGYEPNNLARNLRARSLRVFGLIVPDILASFFTAIARGVEDVAYAHGFSVMLSNSDGDPFKEAEYLRTLRTERVAGIVLGPTEKAHAQARAVLRAGIPLVTIDRRIAELDLDAVTTDSDAGIMAAVEHLHGHGHRAIGFIGGPLDVSTGRRREEAFFAALRRLGLATSSEWVARADFREEGGQQAALEMLTAKNRPSALFIANEMMTLGALRAVRELGLSMPADLAVIGFDDTPWARLLDPPLTVVAQPAYDLGRLAAEALLRRLDEPDRHVSTVLLAPQFLVRASCGEHRHDALNATEAAARGGVARQSSPVPTLPPSRPRGHARGG